MLRDSLVFRAAIVPLIPLLFGLVSIYIALLRLE